MGTNNEPNELNAKHQAALSLHHLVRDIVRNHLQEQQQQGLLEKIETAINLALNSDLHIASHHRAGKSAPSKMAVNARNIH